MSRYLLTGATGFLGLHLARQLRIRGDEVVALVRTESPDLKAMGAIQLKGDVLDAASVEAAAKGCDGLFHCAGMVSRKAEDSDAMWKVHVIGTRVTLGAAKAAGIKRVVVASTSGTVAVGVEHEERNETDETPHGLIARWPYYRSKLYAETGALELNSPDFQVISVNPTLLLGPGDVRGTSTEDVRMFLEKKVMAVPAGGASFVDVRDAAAGMIGAMLKGRPGQRYLLTGCNCTVRDFFGRLERVSGVKAPWIPMPKDAEIAKQGLRFLNKVIDRIGGSQPVSEETLDVAQHCWWVDATKAIKELGFKARDPSETLADTVQDLRMRGIVWPDVSKKQAFLAEAR